MKTNGDALQRWVRSNSMLASGAVELGREMAMFSATRLRANLDAWEGLAACRDVRDLIQWQRRVAETALNQYDEEINWLASRLSGLTRELFASSRPTAARAQRRLHRDE